VESTEVTPHETGRTIPSDTFRARLILARLHAGDLTIREAAARCGLNYGSWSNWERGMKPRDLIDAAEKISEGLGVDLLWLLRGGQLATERRQPRDLNHRSGPVTESMSHRANTHPAGSAVRTTPASTTRTTRRPTATTATGRTRRPAWQHG
jgi:transcriptional regulator with XRE-family HTH domain